MKSTAAFRSKVIFILILSFFITAYIKPWVKNISITTSPDAFVGPAVSNAHPKRRGNIVSIGIAPAPWPSEAREIFDAAQREKVVHVTVISKGVALKFEISGVSESGDLQVKEDSISDIELFRKIIGVR